MILLACIALVARYSFYSSTVRFMSAQETNEFLRNDPDGFVASLNQWDLFARKVQTNQQYIDHISTSGRDWTLEEQALIRKVAQKVDPDFDWVIAKTTKDYELGFPHTRTKDIIFMSEVPDERTLKHEKIHLEEKRGKYDFEKMGFIKLGLRKGTFRLRSNPDLDEYIWGDANGRIYVAHYNSDRPMSIMDIDVDSKYEHPYEWFAYSQKI